MRLTPQVSRMVSNGAKIQVAVGPYLGEYGWQQAGAPGRESFDPLQHVGNMGMGAIVPMLLAGMMSTTMATAHDVYPANHTPNPVERAERSLAWKRKIHTKVALPFAVVGSCVAQVYAETLDSGTHDLGDIEYGLGATGVALFLYHLLRRGDFKSYEFEIAQLKAKSTSLIPSATNKSQKKQFTPAVTYEAAGLSRKEARKRATQERAQAKRKEHGS